jgi:hypothetical protein
MSLLPLSPELLDTFRSLSVKKRQGVLEIISANREYELTFFEGKIIHADRVDQSFIQFLSEQVKSLSSLFSSELENVGRGEQITRLLQLTELELPKLIEFKKAYDRETLSYLAEETNFSFDFRTKIVRCPEGLSLELSPGHYILDLLEKMGTAEEMSQPPAETAKLTINTESVVSLERPQAAIAATTVPDVVQPAVQKEASTKIKRNKKKTRRPPRAGRFKEASSGKKKGYSSILKLNPEQMLMGIKLTLILLLSLFAPGFLSDWSHTLYSFLVL